MIEQLKSFRENLYERVRSPFVGSFIVTWLVLHWKLIGYLIYSDSGITVEGRIALIEQYLRDHTYYALFIYPMLITLGLLVIYSLLNAVGLAIKLSYDNWASPYIQKVLYNKNIIEKPKFEKLRREYNTVKREYDEDREKFVENEKAKREITQALENFQANSFVGKQVFDISVLFDKDYNWVNNHTLPNGSKGVERFRIVNGGFQTASGSILKTQNLKSSLNGQIIYFEKIVDSEPYENYLIKDDKGNYWGVERGNVIINYTKDSKNV